MAIHREESRKNTTKHVRMSQMSRRALYGIFRLLFIIKTADFEQGYLVKFHQKRFKI